jgi:hypothetical protein
MLGMITLMSYQYEDAMKQVTTHMCLGLCRKCGTQYDMDLQSDVSFCVCNCRSVLYG